MSCRICDVDGVELNACQKHGNGSASALLIGESEMKSAVAAAFLGITLAAPHAAKAYVVNINMEDLPSFGCTSVGPVITTQGFVITGNSLFACNYGWLAPNPTLSLFARGVTMSAVDNRPFSLQSFDSGTLTL